MTTTDIPKFTVGDRVAFTHIHSAERIGNVLRRWWAGAWCYAVSDPIAGHGEWLLTESALSPREQTYMLTLANDFRECRMDGDQFIHVCNSGWSIRKDDPAIESIRPL